MGPSGVGKTTLANWLASDCNYLHIDFDQWGGDAASFASLRIGWENYKTTGDIKKLRTTITNSCSDFVEGIVLSFPSDDMLVDLAMLNQAKKVGVHPIIMYADAETCKQTFINREMNNGRGLPVEHWQKYNAHIYKEGYLTTEHKPYLLNAYDSVGHRYNKDALLGMVIKLIA